MNINEFINWVKTETKGNNKISASKLKTYFINNINCITWKEISDAEAKVEFLFWVIRETEGTGQISKKELDEKLEELKLDKNKLQNILKPLSFTKFS